MSLIKIYREEQTEAGYLLGFHFLLPGREGKYLQDESEFKTEAEASRYLLLSTKDLVLIWIERYLQLYMDVSLSPSEEIASNRIVSLIEKINPRDYEDLTGELDRIVLNMAFMLGALASGSEKRKQAQAVIRAINTLIVDGPHNQSDPVQRKTTDSE